MEFCWSSAYQPKADMTPPINQLDDQVPRTQIPVLTVATKIHKKNVRPKESPTTRHSILIYYMNYTQYMYILISHQPWISTQIREVPSPTTFLAQNFCHLLCQSWDIKVFCMALGTKASCIHDLGDESHIFAEDISSFNQNVTRGGDLFWVENPVRVTFKWDVTSLTFLYKISGLLFHHFFYVPNLWAPHNLSSCTASVFSWPINIKASKSGSPIELELQVEKKSSESTPANTWMGNIYV